MKIHKKKFFRMKNQFMTQKKKKNSKILINFMNIHKKIFFIKNQYD